MFKPIPTGTLEIITPSVPFADALIKVRKVSAETVVEEDAIEWKLIHVYRVLLAASCEYLRGLWVGAFSEAQAPAEVQLDDLKVRSLFLTHFTPARIKEVLPSNLHPRLTGGTQKHGPRSDSWPDWPG